MLTTARTKPIGKVAGGAGRTAQDVHVQTVGLRKEYRTISGDTVEAVAALDLSLQRHEFVSIVGPSGCGKTTVLKLLAGLIQASDGEILLDGTPVSGPQKGAGVVFQSPVLFPWLTILDNVLLPIRVHHMNVRDYMPRARDLLSLVGLQDFAAKYPSELSGGMQQRAAIIRALIHDPGLLLMDEPFAALDALTRDRMAIELQRIWLANRKTVFFITHSIPEAVFLSDRVLVMSARPGRIIREFHVPFERPRSIDIMGSPEFGRIATEARHLLEGDS